MLTAKFIFLQVLLVAAVSCKIAKISNLRVKTANGDLASRERKLKSFLENFTGGDKEAERKAQQKYQKQKNTIMLLGVMGRQRNIKKISTLVENLQDALENLKASVESEVGQLSAITQAAEADDIILIQKE